MKNITNPLMEGADPFILVHNHKYYLYFTKEEDGFKVYESSDLLNWVDRGYALKRGKDVVGKFGFWAPEIIYKNNLFYMIYVSEEHMAIATSTSPLGPFTKLTNTFLDNEKGIDGHLFIDDDGQIYLYFVRFDGSNIIHACKMNNDMSMDKDSETFLLRAELPWETVTDYKVIEGPFVLKYNNKYYLSYSCNHTESPDYAIGYAVSDSPLGPFVKYEHNPILKKNENVAGVGHHSFFNRVSDSQLMCVYHRHQSVDINFPRMICLDEAYFAHDILNIKGPTF